MTNSHNHAPRCCCKVEMDQGRCPACTEHGELAKLAAAPNRCPSCGAGTGQCHTDYCQLILVCGCPADGMQSAGCTDPEWHRL